MEAASLRICVQEADFDLGLESARLRELAGGTGALCSFVGVVRPMEGENTASDLQALEIEHYPAMTAAAIETICENAGARWPLLGVTVIHRIGRLAVGEQIVLVLVAAEHREAAFNGCECVMDYLKTRAPFWKKALFDDSGYWVEARQSDRQREQRWGEES